MKVKIEAVGILPLVMSTQAGADPTHPQVVELAQLTRIPGPKKTPEIHEQIERIQFLLNLHWDEELGVVVPAINLKNAIWDISKEDKCGKLVERYVNPGALNFKLVYKGPQDRDGLAADKRFYYTALVNHGSKGKVAMVRHTRPKFDQWGLQAEFRFNEEKIDPRQFEKWVHAVGESTGIGAYKKMFGRFEAVIKGIKE